jgi:hypothetical protein
MTKERIDNGAKESPELTDVVRMRGALHMN